MGSCCLAQALLGQMSRGQGGRFCHLTILSLSVAQNEEGAGGWEAEADPQTPCGQTLLGRVPAAGPRQEPVLVHCPSSCVPFLAD